ncbi:MAG: flagellar hook assembly protein FlgD [bacterium]
MSMSGKLQSRIAPVMTNGTRTYNPEETAAPKDKAADKVEFHKLLQNSNSDVTRERMAKKSGDLSSAKTDEEFRKMLSDKSNPQRAPKNTLGKDDFMKLFIAQMQAQDPLNPQDATQMSAQMAQFNSLEQMMNLNKSLDTMIKGQSTDRAVSMVNYVGKEVDIGNGLLKWDKNKLTKSTFEIDQPLANATVEVRDGSGQIVSQEDLGNLMPGEHNVKWTGKMKDGNTANSGIYNFAIIAKTTDGQEVAVPIKTKVKVTGIDMQAEGGAFFTEVGKIDIKDIASVGLQGFDEAKTALNTLGKTPIKEAGNEITEAKNEDTEGDPKGENQALSTNPEMLAKPASEGTMETPEGNSQEAAEPSDLIADTDKRAGSPTVKSPIEIPVNVSEL